MTGVVSAETLNFSKHFAAATASDLLVFHHALEDVMLRLLNAMRSR